MSADVEWAGRIVPNVPAKAKIDDLTCAKLNRCYNNAAQNTTENDRHCGKDSVHKINEKKADAARYGHTPMGAPPPQHLNAVIQNCAREKGQKELGDGENLKKSFCVHIFYLLFLAVAILLNIIGFNSAKIKI